MNYSTTLITILITVTLSLARGVLNQYDHFQCIDEYTSIKEYYHGPLFATGLADANMDLFIDDMPPAIVGWVKHDRIIFCGDDTYEEEVYEFSKVKRYEVIKDSNTLYVDYIRAKRNGKRYEIVIEYIDGPNYERVLWVYYKGKPHSLILWKEKLLIVPVRKITI